MKANVCGNGLLESTSSSEYHEVCDDGNLLAGDGCSSTCRFESFQPGHPCTDHGTCRDGICRNQVCEAVSAQLLDAPGPMTKLDHFLFGQGVALTRNHLYVSRFGHDICELSKHPTHGEVPGCVPSGAIEVYRFDQDRPVHHLQIKPAGIDVPIHIFGGHMVGHEHTLAVSSGAGESLYLFVYDEEEQNWTQPQVLAAPGKIPYRLHRSFGTIMALGPDTLALGLPWFDCMDAKNPDLTCSSGEHAYRGLVYIFKKNAGKWSFSTTLRPPSPGADPGFGSALAIDGQRLVVSNSLYQACVSEYRQPLAENFIQACKGTPQLHSYDLSHNPPILITPALEGSGNHLDGFGASVALRGTTLAVGAPSQKLKAGPAQTSSQDPTIPEYNKPKNGGIVYSYRLDQGSWLMDQTLESRLRSPQREFGERVALEGGRLVVSSNPESATCLFSRDSSVNNFNLNPGYCEEPMPMMETFHHEQGGWSPESLLFPVGFPKQPRIWNSFAESIAVQGHRVVAGDRTSIRCPAGFTPEQGQFGCSARGSVSVYRFQDD